MIQNRTDLKKYLHEDLLRLSGKPTIKDLIKKKKKWYIYQYLKHLRYVEYHMNRMQKHSWTNIFYDYIPFFYHWFKYKRLSFKIHCVVYPNTTGPGLVICHVGDFIHIKKSAKIGRNCTLRPGVVIGKKNNENEQEMPVQVGDNVNFGLGVRIFGSVKIGDNVTIGANAVVTKDIPSNSVAVGIPAKVIKRVE